MSEKCHRDNNKNSDNPLTSRCTDGSKNCPNYKANEITDIPYAHVYVCIYI